MARLTRLKGGKFRLRYRITFPDRTWADRSRRYRTSLIAKRQWPKATELEEKTKLGFYGPDEIEQWRRIGFLNDQDSQSLGIDQQLKTLSAAAEEYQQSWDLSPKEAETRLCRLNTIISILHPKTPLQQLTYADGLRLQTELKSRGFKIATIQKYTQDLRRLISLQIANGSLRHNPFLALKGGRIPQHEKIRHVILTEDQISSVITSAENSTLLGGHLSLLLLMAFGCGLRRSEILASRWEGINWEERSLTVKGKGGKPRKVGLGQRIFYELLKRQKPDGYLIPRYAPWSLSRAFRLHLKSCGINMRLHDARHTYTSLLQQSAGAKPIEAMARTGHADMRMLSHYSHGKFGKIFEDSFQFMKVPEGEGSEA